MLASKHLRAAFEKIFAALRADRRVRAHRHEGGGEHLVVLRREARGASARILGRGFEREMQPPRGGADHFTASFADDTTLLTWSNSGLVDCEPLSVIFSNSA